MRLSNKERELAATALRCAADLAVRRDFGCLWLDQAVHAMGRDPFDSVGCAVIDAWYHVWNETDGKGNFAAWEVIALEAASLVEEGSFP